MSNENIPATARKHNCQSHPIAQELAQASLDGLKSRLAYYIDCQLATVEYMASLKRKPINEFRRHVEIAEKMLVDAKVYGVDLAGTRGAIVAEKHDGYVWAWVATLQGKNL